MLDVDKFKQINDQYGHQMGDQALIWVAGLLKEAAGKNGLPIRYAGDEFMLLLLQNDKKASMDKGTQLLDRIHKKPFQSSTLESPLQITLSLGIASAPEDARNSKILIQQADTALYSAKKKGRNRLVNASQVSLEEVFDKKVVHQIEDVKIVGRSRQVSQVAEALKRFSKKKNQFVILQGTAGMGKTEFLEAIRHNLARKKVWQVKVNGTQQEMFRPYYLITKVLVDILKQRKDKGVKVLEAMDQKELGFLVQIMPKLGIEAEVSADLDESTLREGIFKTLTQFIPKVLDNRAAIIFIDDLHFGDEATMLLLRGIMLEGEVPLFICSSSSETRKTEVEEEKVPLERFYEAYHQELGIKKIPLTPLTNTDITKHINRIFPNVHIPEDFKKELTRVSQGNPLFISEILRKLVLDQKITLIGREWFIQPLEEGYFPKSLEEIVTQKIAALDEDSRQMLEQVSAHGEDVSLSMLIGSSDAMEAKVLEFIDQAAAQGLLQTDFQLNDEVIRFLGKRILEITYNAIKSDRKQELHERIGHYQETLYQQQLLPSAATLAYHFKRSTDREKARKYEQILVDSNTRRFNVQEAILYSAEVPSEEPGADIPLDPEGLAQVPKLIRDFTVSVRNIKLYPPGSKSIITVTKQLKETIDRILEKNEILTIAQIEQVMVINDQKVDMTEIKLVAESFLEFLNQFQLKGVAFRRGLTEKEVEAMLEAFGRTDPKEVDEQFWERLMVDKKMVHIDLKQVRYSIRGKADGALNSQILHDKAAPSRVEGRLDQEDFVLVSEILRSLLGSSRTIKLYPIDSKIVTDVLDKLIKHLRRFIERRGVMTISRTGDALLINGEKVVTPDLRAVADKFKQYLTDIELKSLTFINSFTVKELEIFISALGDLPQGPVDKKYWKGFAKEKGISGIFFDQHLFDARVAETIVPTGTSETVREVRTAQVEVEPELEEMIPEKSYTSLLDDFQDRIKDMFLNKDEDGIKETIQKLYSRFPKVSPPDRKRALDVSKDLLESLPPGSQQDFMKFHADPLLAAFSEETDPDMIREMASFLSTMVNSLIQFVEYRTAARILSHLNRRQQMLEEAKDTYAGVISKSFERNLEPSTKKLFVEDLKSGDPSRQKNAAQLLSSLSRVAVPLLIEIIKKEDDYRVRQIAALLLKKQGPAAFEPLKSMLVLEIDPEERLRILDIIDTLSSDLKLELGHALGDTDPRVQEAAFRLAERLNDEQTIQLLMDLVKSQQDDLTVASIKCLVKLNPSKADEALKELLNVTKDDELSITCCRALGQIGNPDSIEALSKILAPKGFFLLKKKRSNPVRAAAAFALGRIAHPQASEVLAPFINDGDPRIREIARSVQAPAEQTS